jgi:hypothetical protein
MATELRRSFYSCSKGNYRNAADDSTRASMTGLFVLAYDAAADIGDDNNMRECYLTELRNCGN